MSTKKPTIAELEARINDLEEKNTDFKAAIEVYTDNLWLRQQEFSRLSIASAHHREENLKLHSRIKEAQNTFQRIGNDLEFTLRAHAELSAILLRVNECKIKA